LFVEGAVDGSISQSVRGDASGYSPLVVA